MATLLLITIYIAFIGLGVLDSLFGTAWPAIYNEFSLPISFGSFVTVIISCGTTISSALGAYIINRFGTNKVSAFSTLLTAVALLGFSVSPNIWTMCLCAIPLGIGAGSIDVALNNYVALHYSASHMSFLHCFYGIGVSVSPYLLSLVISSDAGWRGGYRLALYIQIFITVLLFITLPIWKKVHGSEKQSQENKVKTLTVMQTLKIPGVKLMCGLFITSCAIEVTCGAWGSTYLVEYRHLPPEKAAQIVMLYYIGMTLGRFLSGICVTRINSRTVIKIGQCILGTALIILLLPSNVYLSAAGMFMIGLGNGPLFPNFNYLTPENFGSDVSQSVIGVQMATAYLGIMLVPPLCGLLGQKFGMVIFPYYMLIYYIAMIPMSIAVERIVKKKSN